MEFFDLGLKISLLVSTALKDFAHLLQELPFLNRDLLDVDSVLLR